jgi:integrase
MLADSFKRYPGDTLAMTKILTAKAIKNLKAGAVRYEKPDPGCAGLRVVVFAKPSWKKSFVVRYRFRGLQRKLTIGPWDPTDQIEPIDNPELGAPQSLASARHWATMALREAKAGRDLCAVKRRKREEQFARESDTLSAVAAEYLRQEGPKLRTLSQRKADLDLLCAGIKGKLVLGRLPVGEITRRQYVLVFNHIADHSVSRRDRVLVATKKLLNWHSGCSDSFVSPLGPVGRRISLKDGARSRILSDDELRAVWLTAEQDKGPFGAFVRFVLLTATRRNEASGLQRCELSDGGRTWILPAARAKGKRDVLIPLSTAAQQIITAQPERGRFLFTATGARPLTGLDERKRAFDDKAGVQNYRLHDVRRTARTLLSRAGVPADHAERCLGHVIGGVRGVYDRHEYEAEKRGAFEKLAALIERLMHPPTATVVPISAGRK